MTVGTIIFSYNRPDCTEQCLEALKRNRKLPEKLYLFRDGPKSEHDIDGCKKVEDILKGIQWCDTEVIIHNNNCGLARSIVQGVNYAFEKCDAVIVLEDDCIAHPQFMEYMIDSLTKYREMTEVFSVSGYTEPVRIFRDEYDVYFTGRISSLGWGTWKDRWKSFDFDYDLIKKIKRDDTLNEGLEVWGSDLEPTLLNNVTGKNNSWAVFWALEVIAQKGYNLAPYESLVDNIGFDGRGKHSGSVKPNYILQDENCFIDFRFPDKTFFRGDVKDIFKDFYAWTSRENIEKCYRNILYKMYLGVKRNRSVLLIMRERGINCIAIWGKNNISDIIIDELEGEIDICNIVRTDFYGLEEYRGITMCSPENISTKAELILVIPSYDIDRIRRKCKNSGVIIPVVGMDELWD